jgi:hypothetical protein
LAIEASPHTSMHNIRIRVRIEQLSFTLLYTKHFQCRC